MRPFLRPLRVKSSGGVTYVCVARFVHKGSGGTFRHLLLRYHTMSQANASMEYVYSSLAADPELGEIVDMFVEEMPGRVASLLDHFNQRDWDGLRQSAHQLKGAAGSYGFAEITPCAGKLESVLRDGEPEHRIYEALTELVDLCSRVRSGQPTSNA